MQKSLRVCPQEFTSQKNFDCLPEEKMLSFGNVGVSDEFGDFLRKNTL